MKREFLNVAAAALILALTGCSKLNDGAGGQTFRLFWPDEKGEYDFRDVTLYSLENAKELRGESTRVYVNPQVRNNKLTGEPPEARFVRGPNDVLIPANAMSHQALAAFAHVEKLKAMAQRAGLEESKRSLSNIFFHNNLQFSPGHVSRNNAHHIPSLDAISIVPYTQKGAIPTALNAGIIAHEYFHGLFESVAGTQRTVSPLRELTQAVNDLFPENQVPSKEGEPDPDPDPEQEENIPRVFLSPEMDGDSYKMLIEGALNEGLADFWGFLYSGDTSFISRTFLMAKKGRDIEGKGILLNKIAVKNLARVRSQAELINSYYIVGSGYARYMFDLYELAKNGDPLHGIHPYFLETENGPLTHMSATYSDIQLREKFAGLVIKLVHEIGNYLDSLHLNENEEIKADPISHILFNPPRNKITSAVLETPTKGMCLRLKLRGALANVPEEVMSRCDKEHAIKQVDPHLIEGAD